MPAWLDAALGDPPAKPQLPPWLLKAMTPAADATRVARPAPLPQPTIGATAARNIGAPDMTKPLPVDDQGILGSGQGQGLFDILPAVGAVRGVKAGSDIAKAGHLPLGLLVGAVSALPEGGALAKGVLKLGGKKAAAEILERATAGGFTFDPREGSFVERGGVMVGGVPGQQGMVVDEITPAVIKEFAAKNRELLAQPGMMMGGWRDGETGKFHFDVSQKVPHHEAPALLKARGEKAGWDLDAGAEVVNPHANGAVSEGSEPEKIVAAAVRGPDGRVSTGPWHQAAREAHGGSALDLEDGFVTNTGRFVDRDEALQIADRAQQIEKVKADPYEDLDDGLHSAYLDEAPPTPQLEAPNLLGLESERDAIPLDVSIDPAGVNASRPEVARPTSRVDLSVLDPVRRRIRDVYTPAAEQGLRENPKGAAWYDLHALRDIFEQESPTGAQDFAMFTSLLGPTSAGTDVPQNIRQASLFYKLWKEGKLSPEAIRGKQLEIPAGYGNRLNIREPLARVVEQGSLDPINTPKTFRYSQQLGGNFWGGTALDRHVGYNVGVSGNYQAGEGGLAGGNKLGRGFPTANYRTTKLVNTSPQDTHYAAIEDAMIREAEKMGVHPAVYQAAGWVGNAAKTGVEDARHPLEIINEKLGATAKRYGYRNRVEALRAFIRGQTPLWALGGLAAGGGLLSEAGPPDEVQ